MPLKIPKFLSHPHFRVGKTQCQPNQTPSYIAIQIYAKYQENERAEHVLKKAHFRGIEDFFQNQKV